MSRYSSRTPAPAAGRHRKPQRHRSGPILSAGARRWLYGVAAAVCPIATAYGLITDNQGVLWLNLAGAILFTMAVGNTPSRPDDHGGDDAE